MLHDSIRPTFRTAGGTSHLFTWRPFTGKRPDVGDRRRIGSTATIATNCVQHRHWFLAFTARLAEPAFPTEPSSQIHVYRSAGWASAFDGEIVFIGSPAWFGCSLIARSFACGRRSTPSGRHSNGTNRLSDFSQLGRHFLQGGRRQRCEKLLKRGLVHHKLIWCLCDVIQ